jgi:hypothetical protein
MTIVRSVGVTTLVALMAANRSGAEASETIDCPPGQARADAVDARLLPPREGADQRPATAWQPSCN